MAEIIEHLILERPRLTADVYSIAQRVGARAGSFVLSVKRRGTCFAELHIEGIDTPFYVFASRARQIVTNIHTFPDFAA